MKPSIFFMFLFFIGQYCLAQLTDEALRPYEQQAERIIKAYTDSMIRVGEWDVDGKLREGHPMTATFITDTMRIESVAQLISENGSTAALLNGISFKLDEYDKLLNKYYSLLMANLTQGDKPKLREAQRQWLNYRDSEFSFNDDVLAPNEYAGGGTMWLAIAASKNVHIVKERVNNLFELLTYL